MKRNIYANVGKAIAQTCVFIFYQVSHKKIRCVTRVKSKTRNQKFVSMLFNLCFNENEELLPYRSHKGLNIC